MDSPDLRRKATKEALWTDDLKTLEWVEMKSIGVDIVNGGWHAFPTNVARVKGDRRSPRLDDVKEMYAHMVECRNNSQVVNMNNLLHTSVNRGSMMDAQQMFDNMQERNVVSWNIMILGYAKHQEGALALDMYARMHQGGVQSSTQTFVAAMKACGSLAVLEEGAQADGKVVKLGCLEKGRAIHVQLVKSGFESNLFVGTTLLDMYTKCGSMEDAHNVFDELPYRNVVSWNAMILGYTKLDEGMLAFQLYTRMQQEAVIPTHRTFVGLLKACSSLVALEERTQADEERKQVDRKFAKIDCLEKGRAIHSRLVKSGFELNLFVGNTLVDMYTSCGNMEDAQHVFDRLPDRNVISWNAIILGYSKHEQGDMALDLYEHMHQEAVKPDHRTFVGALKACSCLAALEKGKRVEGKFVKVRCLEKSRAIHSQAVTSGCESDAFVGSTLVDTYAKSGSMEDARCVFDRLPYRNVVTWTAMILGYAEQGENKEAFKLYALMQDQGLSPDSLAFVSILKACGDTAALETGKKLHDQILRAGLQMREIVATSLIDMYGKCGSMIDAQDLFDALPTCGVVTWNALIAGYARQGESGLVFDLFKRMNQEGIQPNEVTFTSILTVCSHVGLVEEGHKYFLAMSIQYGIAPTIEHYTCMVDLLSRVGELEGAVAMVEKMPFQPDIIIWGTVLGACRNWANLEVGRHAFENAVRLDGKFASAFILISSMYAEAQCGRTTGRST